MGRFNIARSVTTNHTPITRPRTTRCCNGWSMSSTWARTAWRTAPPEAARALTMPAPRAIVPEETLWQGRPSFLGSAWSALAAATWTGLGVVALGQTPTVAAHLEIWHGQAQACLFEHGSFATLWWYEQGVGWFVGPDAAEAALSGVLRRWYPFS